MSFNIAFDLLIGHEGGYVNHPKDPGGETNFGISKRQYPSEDIKGMTLERAKEIYKRDYWDRVKGDSLPFGVAFDVFDAAVNHGVGRAILWMQEALHVSPDGIVGPVTLSTAQAIEDDVFRRRFNGVRLMFFTDLPTWPAFGRGWARRVANNLLME